MEKFLRLNGGWMDFFPYFFHNADHNTTFVIGRRLRRIALSVALVIVFSVSVLGLLGWQTRALAALSAVTWPAIGLTQLTPTFDRPVYVTHAGDGSGRLFVVERPGRIQIIKNGATLAQPFLNITARVGSSGSEEGLLSVAFPPNFSASKRFYVYYNNLSGDLVIARFGLTANADDADESSEQIILTIPHPTNANHNGGQLQFSPRDGFLYMATGDGGAGGDPPNNAQTTNVLLGKMLRLNVETGNPTTYTIPITNPFTQTAGYRPEIWALGLRNPWRFSFDRLTSDLYIGDVGQGAREEVDLQVANSGGGENYGWSCLEGTQVYSNGRCNSGITYTAPISDYSSLDPVPECAVTGGYVYRGATYPTLNGIYFFGDYCSGKIWGLKFDSGAWQSHQFLDTDYNISSFGEDEVGNVYVVNLNGTIHRVIALDKSVYLPLIRR